MSKSKKAAKKQPEWLNQSPTVMMRRELENATTHICHMKGLKPSKLTRDSIAFADLLPYLKVEHDRWDDVEPRDFTTSRPKCIKGLYDHFHHFRRNEQDLSELMELSKDRFSLKKASSSGASARDQEEQDGAGRPD